jgi:hypothetical protein
VTRPSGFANPLTNPFSAPRDRFGNPRVHVPEAELEAGMRRYCLLNGIPTPKGRCRAKAIPKPAGGRITRGMADSYLARQLNWLRPGA